MEKKDENTSRVRHIRLPVTQATGEKGYAFPPEKEKEKIPKRNYEKGVKEILRSSFFVDGRKMNIFKIKLTGKPAPSEIDDIFDWFRAKPAAYLSIQEIVVKTSSQNFSKAASKLLKKARKDVRKFVEAVELLKPKEKMIFELADIILREKDHPEKLKLIIFLVPGFKEREIQDLSNQISSLISKSTPLEILDSDNGILLSSINVEDAKSLVEKPYILQISEDIKLQPSEEVKPFETPPDIIPPKDDDPIVCVIDTGADPKTLGSALVESSYEDEFTDGRDTHGHGTQVSSVIIWGRDMFSGKNQAIGKCRVISHKFDRFGHFSSLYRAVDNAIGKFSKRVKIFNLSANISKHNQKVERLTMYLDQKIRRKNIILVNSTGNIPCWAIEKVLTDLKYPEYLKEFLILPPANGNNIVGVGSYAMKSSKNLAKKFQISPYSPLGKSNTTYEHSQKPDILVRGGNYEIENGKVTKLSELGVPVFGLNSKFSRNFGTSFATPLAASLLAQIYSFYPDISYSETLRALLISASELFDMDSGFSFQLKDEKNIFSSNKNLIYYAENILPARIEYLQNINRFRYIYDQVRFFVPKGAESVRVITVHSDDLPISRLGFLGSVLNVDVYNPESDDKLRKNNAIVWLLNKHTPINFAVFAAVPGIWNIELTIRSTDLPRTLTNELKVRYGLVIRINLREERNVPLHAIRETAVQKMDILH
jgi:hypothetical protein